jgi:hypothetical protein
MGDVRPDKDKAPDKIDGQVALDMALARWMRQPLIPASVYLTRGSSCGRLGNSLRIFLRRTSMPRSFFWAWSC